VVGYLSYFCPFCCYILFVLLFIDICGYGYAGAPFAPQLGKIIKAVPIKDLRTLKLRWPYPSQYDHYRTGAARGLSHLLGHEGPGSVFAVLKKQGLVNSLMAGTSYDTREFALFGITIDLTEEGLKRWPEVVTTIYQYIALVGGMNESSWRKLHAELHLLSALSFRFKGKEQPMGYATSLADNFQQYAPQHLLDGGYLSNDFDYSRIREVIASLTPANSNIELVSKTFAGVCDQVERWYQTSYRIDDYDSKVVLPSLYSLVDLLPSFMTSLHIVIDSW
jgi:insulysin